MMNNKISLKWRRRDWFWVALIGLLTQGLWAVQMAHPSYMDAYYYATNGQRLADGHGFTEQVIWQFLDEPAGIPTPSHTYWMPFTSMLAMVGYTVSSQFWGAQLPFWLLSGLLPLLAALISLQFFDERWQVWTAVLLTASGGFYSRFFNQPSTFAPFAWAGGLCLLFLAWGRTTRAPRQERIWWLLAGVMAGLAHLTRADGVLLLGIGGLVWLLEIRDRRLEIGKLANLQSPISNLFILLVGYLLIMGGWFAHNLIVLGRPLPTVGTQTIFLTTYDDLFAYGRSFDLTHLLNWGWGNILRSKWDGLLFGAQTFVAVCCLVFLLPFVLWGWIKMGRQPATRPFLQPLTWYALALFASMGLLFTFPGNRGGLFHSSVALWPWLMTLAAGGIGLAVDWAAQRLPHWQPARAKRIFSGLFVAVAFIISVAIGIVRDSDDTEAVVYEEIGRLLPETAVVMVGNAPGFYYHTGRTAVSVPNEPLAGLLAAANQFHVTHLILDKDHPQPLTTVYEGDLPTPDIQLLQDYGEVKLYLLFSKASP